MERTKKKTTAMSDEKDESSPLTGHGKDMSEEVKVTCCSRAQAPVQSFLRPAFWVPLLNRLHSHRELWISQNTTAEGNLLAVQRAVLKVKQADKSRSDFIISKVESNFLQIRVFTRAEWLDIIEMRFEDQEIKIKAFSSGFLPLCIPGACLFNVLFFWVPFLDMGMNEKRLKWIHNQMDVPVLRDKSA